MNDTVKVPREYIERVLRQENTHKDMEFLRTLLATAPKDEQEVFGHWVEHTFGEPVLVRKGGYIPNGENYTVTPLYTHPATMMEASK